MRRLMRRLTRGAGRALAEGAPASLTLLLTRWCTSYAGRTTRAGAGRRRANTAFATPALGIARGGRCILGEICLRNVRVVKITMARPATAGPTQVNNARLTPEGGHVLEALVGTPLAQLAQAAGSLVR